MMRSIPCSMLFATLTACSDRGTPPQAYQHWGDRLAVAVGLSRLGIVWPCNVKVEETKNVAAYSRIPVDQCYRMGPARHWKGLWRNEFEESRFCPAPAKQCSYRTPGERIWLSFPAKRPYDNLEEHPGVYAVDFIGRETAYSGNYGHMGDSSREVLVDRLMSMRQVEVLVQRRADGTLK